MGTKWAHADVFDALSESSSTAPVAIELDYYRCKMDLREVVEEALGISVGNAALVYILTSVICVHALVRALGKCGAVRFRNGRFISPVVARMPRHARTRMGSFSLMFMWRAPRRVACARVVSRCTR